MQKTGKALSVFSHLLVGLGCGAVVNLLTHDNATSGVAAGLGVSLGKDAIDKVVSSFSSHGINSATEHLFEYICNSDTDPTPNLRELFLVSFDKAMDILQKEYLDIGSAGKYEDTAYVENFFNTLKCKHDNLFSSIENTLLPGSDFETLLDGNSYHTRRLIFDKLGISRLEPDMYDRFRRFLDDRLIPRIISCFYAELQNPKKENIPAWREFQRLGIEAINFQLSQLKDTGGESLACLKSLNSLLETYNLDVREQNELFSKSMDNLAFRVSNLESGTLSIRMHTEFIINAQRLNQLRLFTETETWVRKKYGRGNSYSPSLIEFKEGRVCVPREVKSEVEQHLENGSEVMLLGKPASGKTVFGLAIAMQWVAKGNTISIYLDIADVGESGKQQLLISAFADIDLILSLIDKSPLDCRLLIILDNIHNDQDFTLDLLEYVEEKRGYRYSINALCLTRTISNNRTETNNVFSFPGLHAVRLFTNEEAFLCVANRLSYNAGCKQDYSNELASSWIKTCGGNLIAFAMAFNPQHPDALNETSISTLIYQKYLKRAEDQNNLNKFLELCTLNSLDIDLKYPVIWNKLSTDALFPVFTREQVIEVVERNSQFYCRLFHPSLASLCIKVCRKLMPATDQIPILFDLCKRDTETLAWVLIRMNTRQYWDLDMIKRFVKCLNQNPGTLTEAFLQFPTFFQNLTGLGTDVNWQDLTVSDEQFARLCQSLARSNSIYAESFLRFIQNSGLSDKTQDLLRFVLSNETFQARLLITQPLHICSFFKFVESTNARDMVAGLMRKLLDHENFLLRLYSRPLNSTIVLLDYLGSSTFHQDADFLLHKLLISNDFYQNVVHSQPDLVALLFKYLTHSKYKSSTSGLVMKVCHDPEFREVLQRSSGNSIIPLLKYLTGCDKNLSIELLKFVLGSAVFNSTVSNSPLKYSIGFIEYAYNKGYKEEVRTLCLELLSRTSFVQLLVQDDIDSVNTFFRLLIYLKLHSECLRVIVPYINSPVLINRLKGHNFSDFHTLLKLIASLGRQDKLSFIFDELTSSREFCESLFRIEFTTTIIPFVRFLSENLTADRQMYIDKIFKTVDWKTIQKHSTRIKPSAAACLLAAIVRTDILFPIEYEDLLRKIAGNLFQDVGPHPDFPQSVVLTWDVQSLIARLHPLLFTNQRFTANLIVASLMDDSSKFEDWLAQQPEASRLQLKVYAEANNLSLLREYFTPEFITKRRARDIARNLLL